MKKLISKKLFLYNIKIIYFFKQTKAADSAKANNVAFILFDSAELHKSVMQHVVATPYPAIIRFIAEQADVGTHALVTIVDELPPDIEPNKLG